MKAAIIACMRELLDAAHCVLRTRTPVPRPQSGLRGRARLGSSFKQWPVVQLVREVAGALANRACGNPADNRKRLDVA